MVDYIFIICHSGAKAALKKRETITVGGKETTGFLQAGMTSLIDH